MLPLEWTHHITCALVCAWARLCVCSSVQPLAKLARLLLRLPLQSHISFELSGLRPSRCPAVGVTLAITLRLQVCEARGRRGRVKCVMSARVPGCRAIPVLPSECEKCERCEDVGAV